MKKYLVILFIAVLGLSSCLKDNNPVETVDPYVQLGKDTVIIKKFLADNNIQALKHSSGVYYQILSPGSGNVVYSANTNIEAIYTGRLLNGTVFDTSVGKANYKTLLGNVIAGWQIGVQLIQEGGKIRLFIPSGYAYGSRGQGSIPPNSVLDFDIELIDVQ